MAIYSVTIANGASLSDAATFARTADADNGEGLIRIDMPSAWTAASLTFQVSDDGTNYRNLYTSAGSEYTVQADASRAIVLPPADFAGVKAIKVRSGTAASAVNQGGARTVQLVTRPL